jgi:uncharacterized protein (DUF427 family)
MCCTFAPARLSDTILYSGDALWEGRYVHVLAYQNMASTAGPNAMILPLPALRLGPENAVDARPFGTFLEDIREATRWERDLANLEAKGRSAEEAEVFDVGSYTVVLSASASAVLGALGEVPANRRPAINARMIEAFSLHYPGWPVALCCWNGDLQPEPLLWWYEPRDPEQLFAPALDAHDGGPPDLGVEVLVDHHVAFGSAIRPYGRPVHYRQDAGPFRSLLPPRVRGTHLARRMRNGDFWSRVADASGSAMRRAPGTSTGKPVPLDGWEGKRPSWGRASTLSPQALARAQAVEERREQSRRREREALRIEPAGKRLRIALGGETIVDTDRAFIVHEEGRPPRYYVPREDVRAALAEGKDDGVCPWKGTWRSLDVSAGGKMIAGGAWSYVDPTPRCRELRGHVAFFPEKMGAFTVGWGLFKLKLPFS